MSHNTEQLPHIASVKTYLLGFGIALGLTLAAFAAVEWEWATGKTTVAILLSLAVIQTIVQLWFFLHVGREDRPQWNLIFLLNTIGIILLIVVASIWIMNSLNSRMMSPEQMEKYMIEEGSKGF